MVNTKLSNQSKDEHLETSEPSAVPLKRNGKIMFAVLSVAIRSKDPSWTLIGMMCTLPTSLSTLISPKFFQNFRLLHQNLTGGLFCYAKLAMMSSQVSISKKKNCLSKRLTVKLLEFMSNLALKHSKAASKSLEKSFPTFPRSGKGPKKFFVRKRE